MRARNPFIRIARTGESEPVGFGLISDDERARLHDLLDRIIDQRENLQGWLAESPFINALLGKPVDPNSQAAMNLANTGARLAFAEMIKLAVEALGPARSLTLPTATDDPENIRWALWLRLQRVAPLIDGASSGMFGKSGFPLPRVLDELENLSYGDIGTIFRAPPRKPSQRRNRGKLAKLRLKALAWDRWLQQSEGLSALDAHSAIEQAYRTEWEAIRKWKSACRGILGAQVDWALNYAAEGNPPRVALLHDWRAALSLDGEEYRAALRAEPGA